MRKTIAVMFAVGALVSVSAGPMAFAQQAPSIELGAQPLPHQFPPIPPANETAPQRQARWQAWHDANPNIEAEIAAFVQTSSAQATSYRAQLDALRAALAADPHADIRRRSARLTQAQRQEALDIFSNAFSLWQAGQFDAAEVLFLRGLEIDPANAPANFYFGDILTRKNDRARAADYMRRAVAFGPNSQQAALAEVALRTLPPVSIEPDAIRVAPPAVFDVENRPTALWDCASCPEMAVIPAGSFTIGDQVRVTLPAPIAVGRFEVTFDEWSACVQGGGCASNRSPDDGDWGRGRRPVINVSWNDAQEYVAWLSRTTGKSYRLLSEAEWEYAARAGTTTAYWWGDQDPICDQHARNGANFRACDDDRSRVVGSFVVAINAFGLTDIAGNVTEWVEDCHLAGDCQGRILRDGPWAQNPGFLRVARRSWAPATARGDLIGFRVARTLS